MRNMSTDKKKHIFEAAIQLCYEKGFNNTSFTEIAALSSEKKALVQYHYTTKANLGNAIYEQYSLDQFLVFERKAKAIDDFSFVEVFIAYTLFTIDYYKTDTNAFRFYREFFSNAFEFMPLDIEQFFIDKIKDSDFDTVHTNFISIQYALRGLIYHYVNGNIKLSQTDFYKYIIRTILSDIYGPYNDEDLLKTYLLIKDKIDLHFKENFVWA